MAMAGPLSKTEELRVFCEVASRGSFSASAEALGLSPSSVSKQVRSLESALGVRLFHRTTRRVSLTEVGSEFYERAADVLERLSEAEAAAGELQETPRGTLRLTMPMDFGRRHMATILAGFAARYPEVSLDVDLTDRHVDVVEEGLDLAVRIGSLADSSLTARRLGPCRLALVASPSYVAKRGEPTEPDQLRDHECIAYTLKTPGTWEIGGARIAVTPRHRVNNGEMIRELAVSGCGIAFLPTFIVGDDVRARRLTLLMQEQPVPTQWIHAVYPHRRSVPAKARAFLDELAAVCSPAPAWDAGLPAAAGAS